MQFRLYETIVRGATGQLPTITRVDEKAKVVLRFGAFNFGNQHTIKTKQPANTGDPVPKGCGF